MGHSYCGKRHHEGGASKNGYCDFTSMCVSAGQGQKWGCITEKVMDCIGVTEMQFVHAKHIDNGICKAKQIRSKDKRAASSGGHNDGVMQRVVDGCTAIIGHRGEKGTLSGAQEDKAIHLSEAVRV